MPHQGNLAYVSRNHSDKQQKSAKQIKEFISQRFTPVTEISTKLLEPFKTYLDIVKSVSDLTVKTVNKSRNRRKRISGSGFIRNLTLIDSQCTCSQCHQSDEPKLKCAVIEILTASHVVCSLHAFKVMCELYFNSNDCQWTLNVTEATDIGNDVCLLKCITCDSGLISKLIRMIDTFTYLFSKFVMTAKYLGHADIVIIVSHPHGFEKQVSVGYLYEVTHTYCTYSNVSCNGSSGAIVLCPGLNKLALHIGKVHARKNEKLLGLGRFQSSDLTIRTDTVQLIDGFKKQNKVNQSKQETEILLEADIVEKMEIKVDLYDGTLRIFYFEPDDTFKTVKKMILKEFPYLKKQECVMFFCTPGHTDKIIKDQEQEILGFFFEYFYSSSTILRFYTLDEYEIYQTNAASTLQKCSGISEDVPLGIDKDNETIPLAVDETLKQESLCEKKLMENKTKLLISHQYMNLETLLSNFIFLLQMREMWLNSTNVCIEKLLSSQQRSQLITYIIEIYKFLNILEFLKIPSGNRSIKSKGEKLPVGQNMDNFIQDELSVQSVQDTPVLSSAINERGTHHNKFINDICLQSEPITSKTPLNCMPCEKGIDHSKYKELSRFSKDDLPSCYRHNEMLNLIKSLSDLTIMIQLPCSEIAKYFLQGTGKIDDVFLCTAKDRPCCCRNCKTSESPSMEWGQVRIITSANLVSGCKDVTKIKCTLFYDEENTDDKIKFLYGDVLVSRSTKRDICKFVCITCDMGLLQKLDTYVDAFVNNWSAALTKYYPTVKSAEERLLVMVSHPHGCKKHVSLGKWSKLKPHVQYDAATCPGCSGSYLLIPNFDVDDDDFK